MLALIGLFSFFSDIDSACGDNKSYQPIIVRQVKVGDRPVCRSENAPLVFYDGAMNIIEVIFATEADNVAGLVEISGDNGAFTSEMFELFGGKAIVPISKLESGFYTIELSFDDDVFSGSFKVD